MLILQRVSRPSFLRVRLSVVTCRSISATSIRWSTSAPEPPTPEEENELAAASAEQVVLGKKIPEQEKVKDSSEESSSPSISYKQFLSTIGVKYKYARPNSWLGGGVVSGISFALAETRLNETWI